MVFDLVDIYLLVEVFCISYSLHHDSKLDTPFQLALVYTSDKLTVSNIKGWPLL